MKIISYIVIGFLSLSFVACKENSNKGEKDVATAVQQEDKYISEQEKKTIELHSQIVNLYVNLRHTTDKENCEKLNSQIQKLEQDLKKDLSNYDIPNYPTSVYLGTGFLSMSTCTDKGFTSLLGTDGFYY